MGLTYWIAGRCGLVLLAMLGLGSPGDLPGRPGTLGEPRSRAGRLSDEAEDAAVHTTAEDVLKALQKLRPHNAPIPPASAGGRPAANPRHALWPEGSRMVSRPGRLIRDGRWWTFAPTDDEGEPPLKLLPNATLEAIVRTSGGAAGAAGASEFVVSGELTVFLSENYLLSRFSTRSMVATPEPSGPDESAADADEGEPVAADASAEDVLALLRQQRPMQEAVTAETPAAIDAEVMMPEGGQPAFSDGSPLIGRPGRMVVDGDWWTFVFESDDEVYPEPPMKLLPNQNVELMTEASALGSNGLVFMVSGEVTAFGGENYLLPRAVMRRVDMGNLRK